VTSTPLEPLVRDRPSSTGGRPIPGWAFVGAGLTAIGGPLALSALLAPSIAQDGIKSGGLITLAAAVVFLAPLGIWMRYSRHIATSGGLYSFVEAAVGHRLALVQGGLWILSYLLYIMYTTTQVVYDTLPVVVPGIRPFQPLLEILIPAALFASMAAGRTVTLLIMAVIGFGQLGLAATLGGLTIAHLGAPLSSFALHAPAGVAATATAQTSLLYICASLPLFLGGETRPATVRRGLATTYALTIAVILAFVLPLAASPSFAREEIPGMTAATLFAGPNAGTVIGIATAVSICGVMLAEYLGLSRLIPAMTGLRRRPVIIGIGLVILVSAPLSLINPDAFYDTLLKISLLALWSSQLLVFATYPRFVRRIGGRAIPAWTLSVISCALALYGVWATLHHASS
jgi:amino acid transporter